jgi:hypothetical protein
VKRILYIIFIALMVFTAFPGKCFAADDGGYPFKVKIIPPSDNIGNTGYYYIPGTPGEKITLQAEVTNISDREIQVNAVPMNAYTGLNGIFYQPPDDVNKDTYSLIDEKYEMAACISGIQPFKLLPGQSETVNIFVTVPDIDTGTMLGSIRFVVFAGTIGAAGDGQTKKNTSILIDEYLAVDTAIRIELSNQAQSSVTVGDPGFDGNKINACIPIINSAAKIETGVSADYEIKDDQGTSLFKGSINSFKMAPMTQLIYHIPWGDAAIKEGAYSLDMNINAYGKTIEFKKTFSIGNETAVKAVEAQKKMQEETNNNTDTMRQDPSKTWIPVITIAILAAFAVLIYMSYKKNREKQNGRTYRHAN